MEGFGVCIGTYVYGELIPGGQGLEMFPTFQGISSFHGGQKAEEGICVWNTYAKAQGWKALVFV
ncbi:hypothetical protein AYI87_10910 [Shewanella sp. KCT]|nr:hypothetical protein AYI87_10910 [Shewanella sp. KCT]